MNNLLRYELEKMIYVLTTDDEFTCYFNQETLDLVIGLIKEQLSK